MSRSWHLGIAGVATLVIAGLAAPLRAQQGESPVPAPLQAVASREITLDVEAAPKKGAPVGGLLESDFKVLDNKVPQTLTSFRSLGAGTPPAEAVVVVDAVNISYSRLAYARDQIAKFLSANEGRLAIPTTLAVVTDTATQMQPAFTTDGNVLSASVKSDTIGLRINRPSSGFYGAGDRVQLSLNALRQVITQIGNRPGRKLLLWVSPGWPLLSGPRVDLDTKEQQQIFATLVSLSNQMRAAQITLYNVNPLGTGENLLRTSYYETFEKGVSKPSQVQLANLSLQVLAVQTGGLVLDEDNDVAAELQRCMDDTRAYYELSFKPTGGEPGSYHALQVNLDKPGLDARTRTGYYSTP